MRMLPMTQWFSCDVRRPRPMPFSAMSDIVLDSGLPFYLGQDGTGRYGCTYNGFIDDFALWTRTLSHDDVKRIYEAGRKGLALGDILK